MLILPILMVTLWSLTIDGRCLQAPTQLESVSEQVRLKEVESIVGQEHREKVLTYTLISIVTGSTI